MKNLTRVAIVECDVPNKNGRMYAKETLEKAIVDLNEVQGTFASDFVDTTIPQDKVSHVASNFRFDEGYLYCNITVLDTPSGKVLQDLLKDQVPVAFRSAGVGEIKTLENGVVEVTDYQLLTVSVMEASQAA